MTTNQSAELPPRTGVSAGPCVVAAKSTVRAQNGVRQREDKKQKGRLTWVSSAPMGPSALGKIAKKVCTAAPINDKKDSDIAN